MDKNRLIQHIQRLIALSEENILSLHRHVKTIKLPQKEYLLKAGRIGSSMYFVEKGCLRMFYINNKLSEQIIQFAIEGWWIADHFSFMGNTASDYYIQSIEKSEVLAIDKVGFDLLLLEVPALEHYFRITMQKAVAAAQHRSKLERNMSKEEFYIHFSESFPEFIQRVPQYMIASYLGLTPEYVSELRKKKQ